MRAMDDRIRREGIGAMPGEGRRIALVTYLFLFLLATALRWDLASTRSFDGDEALLLQQIEGDARSAVFDRKVEGPLWNGLQWLAFQMMGQGGPRGLSFAVGLATLVLLLRRLWARDWELAPAATLVFAFFALNPLQVDLASRLTSPGVAFFLLLLHVSALHRFSWEGDLWSSLALALGSAALLWSHPLSLVVLPASLIALLANAHHPLTERRKQRGLFVTVLFLAAMLLPLWVGWSSPRPQSDPAHGHASRQSRPSSLPRAVRAFRGSTLDPPSVFDDGASIDRTLGWHHGAFFFVMLIGAQTVLWRRPLHGLFALGLWVVSCPLALVLSKDLSRPLVMHDLYFLVFANLLLAMEGCLFLGRQLSRLAQSLGRGERSILAPTRRALWPFVLGTLPLWPGLLLLGRQWSGRPFERNQEPFQRAYIALERVRKGLGDSPTIGLWPAWRSPQLRLRLWGRARNTKRAQEQFPLPRESDPSGDSQGRTTRLLRMGDASPSSPRLFLVERRPDFSPAELARLEGKVLLHPIALGWSLACRRDDEAARKAIEGVLATEALLER